MKQKFKFSDADAHHKIQACPIAYSQVDKHLIKAYSSTVLLVLLFTLITGNYLAIYLVTIDFLIRVLVGIKYSPLCNILTSTLKISALKPVLVNAGAKKIAAQVGLFFALSINIFHFLQFSVLANIFTLMFITAISLDLIFDYCLACKLQSLYLNFRRKEKNKL